jgi:hypothetical protein
MCLIPYIEPKTLIVQCARKWCKGMVREVWVNPSRRHQKDVMQPQVYEMLILTAKGTSDVALFSTNMGPCKKMAASDSRIMREGKKEETMI